MKRQKATAAELLKTGYESISRAWKNETDRGLALVCASYYDDLLDELLRCSFIHDSRVVKDLLGSNGHLSTFSAKINLAYAIGLITSDFYDKLHQIRKIRNDFAHVGGLQDFNDTGMKDRCDTLAQMPSPIAERFEADKLTRQNFELAMSYMLTEFQILINKATHAAVKTWD